MFYVTIHTGFGSMGEASRPDHLLGPYDNVEAARQASTHFFEIADARLDPSIVRDIWCNILDISKTSYSFEDFIKTHEE